MGIAEEDVVTRPGIAGAGAVSDLSLEDNRLLVILMVASVSSSSFCLLLPK